MIPGDQGACTAQPTTAAECARNMPTSNIVFLLCRHERIAHARLLFVARPARDPPPEVLGRPLAIAPRNVGARRRNWLHVPHRTVITSSPSRAVIAGPSHPRKNLSHNGRRDRDSASRAPFVRRARPACSRTAKSGGVGAIRRRCREQTTIGRVCLGLRRIRKSFRQNRRER